MSQLITRINDLVVRIGTESKALRTLLNGNAADLSALQTTAKANVVGSINELKGRIDAAVAYSAALIDDNATASTSKTHSVTKIRDLINSAIAELTAGAPNALNTLDELAAALGDDKDFAANITAALGNRVRVDAVQSFTTVQKRQAVENIGAVSLSDIGNPDTDFTVTFINSLM